MKESRRDDRTLRGIAEILETLKEVIQEAIIKVIPEKSRKEIFKESKETKIIIFRRNTIDEKISHQIAAIGQLVPYSFSGGIPNGIPGRAKWQMKGKFYH